MEYYLKTVKFIKNIRKSNPLSNEIINWKEIFNQDLFTPPPSELSYIPMVGEFHPKQMMEIITRNFAKQEAPLTIETWDTLTEYYETKLDELKSDKRIVQIGLEILLIFSKLQLEELKFYGNKETKYNKEFQDLVEDIWTQNENYIYFDQEKSKRIKEFLYLPSIQRALHYCLNERFEKKVEFDWIRENITKMEIYFTKRSGSLFKGATLRDGILIYFSKIVSETKDNLNRHWADLFTLAMHECSHFLSRIFLGDYNYSSPFAYLRPDSDYKDVNGEPKTDLSIEKKYLEMGRMVELIIFDLIQPDWTRSEESAAVAFLDRSKVDVKLEKIYDRPPPLIPENEHKKLYLKDRLIPSISSAAAEICYQFFY